MRVLYAPHPPQCCTELTPAQLARLDARFRDLPRLRARGTLGLTVQDSADLLGAHLTLSEGRVGEGAEHWCGAPGRLDENPACPVFLPLRGRSERDLTEALALDLGDVDTYGVCARELACVVEGWAQGVVYLLPRLGGVPAVSRRLNLASFFDRVELDALACRAFDGYAVVRAHALTPCGSSLVLRVGRGDAA